MRISRIALLTGAVVIVAGGFAGIAEARAPRTHALNIQLPDGQIEQVRYTEDVQPAIVMVPDAMPSGLYPVFALGMLNQMAAEMNRDTNILFQIMDPLMAPNPGSFGVTSALPPGSDVCTRSIQITYTGNGQAPNVVSRTTGDCGPVPGEAVPAALPNVPGPRLSPNVVQAKAPAPYTGLIHAVSDWQR